MPRVEADQELVIPARAPKGIDKIGAGKEDEFEGTYEAGRSEGVMMRVLHPHRLDTLREYLQRKPGCTTAS